MFRKRCKPSNVNHAVRYIIEELESRQMLSATLNHHGVLSIQGTSHADTIMVMPDAQNSGQVNVSVNGKTKTFDASAIQDVKINAGSGNDTVSIGSMVTTPATVLGGAGNDTLIAGGGADSLNGGAGNDSLVCGTGIDSLNGGNGHDNVQFTPTNAGVALSTLPTVVQTGLTTLAQGATITSVHTFQDDGQTYYGTEVSISGVETRIVVDSAGNPVGNPPPQGRHGGDEGPGGLDQGAPGQNDGVFGSVVSSTATTITLSATNPWGPAKQTTFTVTSTTTITADGTTATLASLKAGTLVSVQTSATDATTATSITAIDKRIHGTVTAVDATNNTITVANPSGTATSYTISSTATVTLAGVTSTLAAVTVNSRVELQVSAVDGTVTSIETAPADNGNPEQPPTNPGAPLIAGGVVIKVDATANTITLADGDGIQTTYALGATATVTLDDTSSTLSAIIAGDHAHLQLSTDGKTVTAVDATDSTQTGGDHGNPGHFPIPGGMVVSVDAVASMLTLKLGDGTSTTYTVASTATVILDGSASTLSALVAGDRTLLQFAADGTTITTILASDQTDPGAHQQGPGGGGQNPGGDPGVTPGNGPMNHAPHP